MTEEQQEQEPYVTIGTVLGVLIMLGVVAIVFTFILAFIIRIWNWVL